ncbi:MAG: acetyl-CoA hydrolase/transferase C-terminal domain-containing protein [Candidatus Didemnitutus sp.]|nr:acetyl-CoA hydrolase/transferase C-terminal domain-containing protein [Candidatus Didemnitutus sp.]
MNHDWSLLKQRAMSPDDVVKLIPSGSRAFLHGGAATPSALVEALARRTDVEGVRVYHVHTEGPMPILNQECEGRVRSVSLFSGGATRGPIAEGRADFMPVFLSDIPHFFRSRRIPLDVAIVQLSPPDKHGLCTLGTSVDVALAAFESSKIILAEINEQMPRTRGESFVPFSRVSAFIATNRPMHQHPPEPEGPVEGRIGAIIANLVEDGSTLQMGIGAIPDAVLTRLHHKRDLGIHTEMFSDRLIPLVEAGAVTNKFKTVFPGRIVTAFCVGTQKTFDFVHDNAFVTFAGSDRTNDTAAIRKNPKVVAINSAIEIDLTGQVCADSMGHRIYSGIGGQMDFIRGAALSPGGKPIIALPSTAKSGTISRITAELKPGAGIVTTRGHIHWVVTEYGVVNLQGMTLRERAEALISIAHPDFREELRRTVAGLRHFNFGGGT